MENIISLEQEFHKVAGEPGVLGDPSGEPAYLYARSSVIHQAREGKESLSRQLLFAHEKAMADGRYIPLEMAYWDIWRGKDADRPEFLKLLSDVKESKRSDLVYIDQTDRLSRNTAVYYVLLHDLTRYGLTARFESEEDELVRHIKLAFDEIELERRRYRQVQANRARATKGYVTGGRPAYGYDLSKDKLHYLINEEQAHWVRQIFEWYGSGDTLRGIAQQLNQQNVDTPRQAKYWRAETIHKILRHEVYKGVFIANRHEKVWVWEGGKQKVVNQLKPESEWIRVAVPAIVTEQQWRAVQQRCSTNKHLSLRNARKHHWLLSGMVRCVCGYLFACKHKKSKRTLASGKVKIYEYDYNPHSAGENRGLGE